MIYSLTVPSSQLRIYFFGESLDINHVLHMWLSSKYCMHYLHVSIRRDPQVLPLLQLGGDQTS